MEQRAAGLHRQGGTGQYSPGRIRITTGRGRALRQWQCPSKFEYSLALSVMARRNAPCRTALAPGTTCPRCRAGRGSASKGCPKGMTVIYRCGDSPWGWSFLALLALGVGCYVGAGVAYAQRVQAQDHGGWQPGTHASSPTLW